MALTFPLTNLRSICFHRQNPRSSLNVKHILFSYNESSKPSFRISADLAPKARFVARRRESVSVKQLERPLGNVWVAWIVLCMVHFWILNRCFTCFGWLQLSTWVCLRASTLCWMLRGLNVWMITRFGVMCIGLGSLLLRFALFWWLKWRSSPMVAALGSCLVKYVVCALYSLFLGFMLCWLLRKKKKKTRRKEKI